MPLLLATYFSYSEVSGFEIIIQKIIDFPKINIHETNILSN